MSSMWSHASNSRAEAAGPNAAIVEETYIR